MKSLQLLLGLLLPTACVCFSLGAAPRRCVRVHQHKGHPTLYKAVPTELHNAVSTSSAASLNQTEPILAETLASTAKPLVPTKPVTESTLRSAVKALCWRLIAGSITFATTLQFSKSMAIAFQIVGADFLSKSTTMFLGERLMNKSQAGRQSGADDASRSLAKALIWRAFAIANTLCMAVFVSKDLSVASKIASTDAVFKTALMYVYERAWARIHWGKSQRQPRSWRRTMQARVRAIRFWLYRQRAGGRRLAWSYSI